MSCIICLLSLATLKSVNRSKSLLTTLTPKCPLWLQVICPDVFLNLTGFFPERYLSNFSLTSCRIFRIPFYIVHTWMLIFDAEQVYLKLQVTILKNKEDTANSKSKTLEKFGFSIE